MMDDDDMNMDVEKIAKIDSYQTELLCNLFECSYESLDFFNDLVYDSNLSVNDVYENALDEFNLEKVENLNQLIYCAYEMIVDNAVDALGISNCEYTIFTDCLDSHLSIDASDPNYKKIVDYLQQHDHICAE